MQTEVLRFVHPEYEVIVRTQGTHQVFKEY
jgi:hypothetical protein